MGHVGGRRFSVGELHAASKTSSANVSHLNVWDFDISAAEFPHHTKDVRFFSAAEFLLRIYQNPIHLNGARWRTTFFPSAKFTLPPKPRPPTGPIHIVRGYSSHDSICGHSIIVSADISLQCPRTFHHTTVSVDIPSQCPRTFHNSVRGHFSIVSADISSQCPRTFHHSVRVYFITVSADIQSQCPRTFHYSVRGHFITVSADISS